MHPSASFKPFDCRIDSSISFRSAVRHLRWLHLIGDSNGRHTFDTWCKQLSGVAYEGTDQPPVSHWDLPKLCLIDNGDTVLTFTHWLTHKLFRPRPELTFAQQCALYSEDPSVIIQQNGMFGWANCTLASTSIQSLAGPGLTYYMWGSHGAELGANSRTLSYLRDQLFAHSFFKSFPVLFGLVPDVDSSLIPDKFGDQYVYRNNERIEAQNQLIINATRHHWSDYPSFFQSEADEEISGFNPIMDMFSPTHAASYLLHGDAVHFYPGMEVELSKWVAHWVMHAPQTIGLRRKLAANTTLTTNSVGFIL